MAAMLTRSGAVPVQSRTRAHLDEALAAIAALLVLMLRPSAFGEVWSLPLMAALGSLAFILLVLDMRREAPRGMMSLLVASAIALGYVHFRTALSVGSADELGKSLLLDLGTLVALFAVVSHPPTTRYFFKWLAIWTTAVCASTVISFGLLAAGMRVSEIATAYFPYTYAGRGIVVFPFTFTFNVVDLGFVRLPRLSGIMREPGLLPPVACWAAAYGYFNGWKYRWVALCLLGSACSLASFGIPLALFAGALLICHRMRLPPLAIVLGAILGGALLWPILYSIEAIGVGSKVSEQSESFLMRAHIIQSVLETRDLLFGDGKGWSGTNIEGITLIGDIRTFGLPYVLLILSIYLSGILRWRFWSVGIAPLLVTVLLSQPIELDPVAMAILLSWVVAPQQRSSAGRLQVTSQPTGVAAPIYGSST